MKKILTLFLTVICTCITLGQDHSKSVLYGEHTTVLETDGTDFKRIYLDKNGHYYPEALIPDSALKASQSEILQWSKTHEAEFIAIAHHYGLQFDAFTQKNYDALQQAIIKTIVKGINETASAYKSVSILIHGFRKPFKTRLRTADSWSHADNKTVKQIMTDHLDKTFFVEVFWDGAYDCCITRRMKKNKTIFKLFENYASSNAVTTGYNLRKVVSLLNADTINVVSHSTGAKVSTTLLCNAYANQVTSAMLAIPTPSQSKINHCLLAPAMSKTPFQSYFDRVTELAFKTNDNYTLSIIYNEKDFVLLKKEPVLMVVGPGPKKYGLTTLGCNHKKEVQKLEALFKTSYTNSTFNAYKIGPAKNHLFTYYASKRAKGFVNWLKFIK